MPGTSRSLRQRPTIRPLLPQSYPGPLDPYASVLPLDHCSHNPKFLTPLDPDSNMP
ncbi:hypothetical protein DPMN_033457 [Dreissena polymorpha]|uniref:Uncharacterized protein n=1 Tax=Dreissena polymorpha TaxID=45954 RepID=A0A9D4M3U2_DREPO|nr:hypothetical protein DPMN_033457 [Dreissena polymorpha]